MPSQYIDGDFTVPTQVGAAISEFPFPADPKGYIYRVPYWQLATSYQGIAVGTAGPYSGYATGMDRGHRDVGGGIISFEREFVFLPDSRSERETFVYDYHFVFYTWGAPNWCTQPNPIRVNSRIQYDYFQTDNPELDINLPVAAQVLETCLGWVSRGDFFNLITPTTSTGTEIVAEDATYKLWKGNIYERRTRYIKWISTVDLIFPP